MSDIAGFLSAVVTPFTGEDSELDETRLRELVEQTISGGAHGLVPCGSTGEFAAMSPGERRTVAEGVLDQVGGRVPVIVHVGAMTTRDAIGPARHAETSGAAAVMAVPPYYEPLTGDVATAKTRWQGIFPIMGFLASGGYVAGVRGALDILGFPVGAARAPIGELQPARRAELETLLKAPTD